MPGATPEQLHYAESSVPAARTMLLALLEQLSQRPGFLGGELLSSPAQPGLYLLVSRWNNEPPTFELPLGVRAWTFVVELQRGPSA